MTLGIIHACVAGLSINREKLVDACYQLCRHTVVGIELHRIEEFPARMRPTRRTPSLQTPHTFICGIAIRLQNPFKLTQAGFRTLASSCHPKIENYAASR